MERVFPFLADTSSPYEQLLAAEQTAQSAQAWINQKKDAIRAIKQQAVDQDLPYDATYRHLKLLEDDIVASKRFLEFNEVSRGHWRFVHMAAWRATVKPLKVVNMPIKILEMIFANFEDVPLPQIQIDTRPASNPAFIPFRFDGDLPSPDVASIKNVRLTCRLFCDVGSRFLLPLVDIFITQSSLQRLQEVSNHPNISKGVRIIRVHTNEYDSLLADDPSDFCDEIYEQLRNLRKRFKNERFITREQVDRDCRLVGIIPKPESFENRGFDMDLKEIDALSVAVRNLQQLLTPFSRFESRIGKTIVKAHKEYERRYLEQKSFSEHCVAHANISTALCHMPSVQKLCIIKTCSDQQDDIWTSGWGNRLDAQRCKSIIRSRNTFWEMMMAYTGLDIHSPLEGDEASPTSLVLELSLLLQAGKGNLRHLDITFPPADDCHTGIAAESLQQLRLACRHLKSVQVRIDEGNHTWTVPASLAATYTQLEAILGSPGLEVVKLDLMAQRMLNLVDGDISVGPLLANLPWKKLQTLCLAHFPIKVEELRQVLAEVVGKVHLDLTDIYLLEGTWAEALEVLRGRADSLSRVLCPRGFEVEDMSRDELQYLEDQFDIEHRDRWYSAQRCPGPASFYIRGGNIPNPLIRDSD